MAMRRIYCPDCDAHLTPTNFYPSHRDRQRAYCKSHHLIRVKRSRGASPRNYFKHLLQATHRRRYEVSITADDLTALFRKQKGRCAITGLTLTLIHGQGRVPTNASIDRIDSNLGYINDNIQLVAAQANYMKGRLTHTQLRTWCQLILANLGRPYPQVRLTSAEQPEPSTHDDNSTE